MFESSVGNRAQALPSSQFTNHLPINAYLSSLNDVDSESLQWQKQEHSWEIACTNNVTTKPSPTWTTYIILHQTTGADCFLSNHSTIHWFINCIERSIKSEMAFLKQSWSEKNRDDSWEITHKQVFVMSKKMAGTACYYGVKQFQNNFNSFNIAPYPWL